MKTWTREELYRPLQSADEIRPLHESIRHSAYRQMFHIQPLTGLSNDPNGFVCFDGVWHCFYQWFPWGAAHGLKHWYHVTSPDLIHWNNEGLALAPDRDCDNKGVYSGSAIPSDGRLCLFYTGNHRDEDWRRTAYTCAAVMDKNGKVQKASAPLFGPHGDYTEHQRDPSIVRDPDSGSYYLFLGAQTKDRRGRVLAYRSDRLLSGWAFAGELKIPGYEDFGGMWECPCLLRVGEKDLLLFSPQYIKLPDRGENTNHNVYLLGSMDFNTLTFTPDGDFQHLDHGFDFYAAQAATNVPDPNIGVLTAWMGLPDNHYPTEAEQWEGCLTLPRELRVENGRLLQTPVSGIETLREAELPANGSLPPAGEMEIRVPSGDFDLSLYCKADGSGGMTLHYDAAARRCTVDRRGMETRFNQHLPEVLTVPLDQPLTALRVFLDRSSTEIFFNHGEKTFTTHSYPTTKETHYTISPNSFLRLWRYAASVSDDFVV